MSIYQNWEPAVITNGSRKKQNNSFKNVKTDENEDEMPKKLERWPYDLIIALKQLRDENKISQTVLAQKLNLPATTVVDIEANKSNYNPRLYKTIYRFLGGDPKSLNFPKV